MTAARPAATVVLLRDTPAGPEVLMVRRNRQVAFMADAYVFPGGRLEPADLEAAGAPGGIEEAARIPEGAFAAGGARELYEEAGVRVEPSALVSFARWITPSSEPRRYDAHFFLARMPEGQVARHDQVETVEHLWACPAELLERYLAGELKLPPPTIRNLEDLAPHPTVAAALAWARARPFTAIMPKLVPLGSSLAIVLPWDPEYPALDGEGAAIDPSHPVAQGASRFVLEEGRWWGRRGA